MPTPVLTTPSGPPAVTLYRRMRAAIAAEWIKLRSLRCILLTLLVAVIFCVGLAALVCSNYAANWHKFNAARRADFNPLDVNFGFVQIGVLFFGMLGALVVTNEYGNGLIRTTFAAMPQRGLVLAAKTVLVGVLALVAATAICFTAFFVGQGRLSGQIPHVGLGDSGVLGHVLGSILYLTAAGLIGLFIGSLTRGSAVATSSVFGLFLVLPVLVNNLPHSPVWRRTAPYLPSNLGNALWHSRGGDLVDPHTAALVLPVYVVVFGVIAVFQLRVRDA